MTNMVDYYQILQVQSSATQDDVRRQFKRLSLRLHPDKNPNDPMATANFQMLAEAYTILHDPVARREYDSLRTWLSVSATLDQCTSYCGNSFFAFSMLSEVVRVSSSTIMAACFN